MMVMRLFIFLQNLLVRFYILIYFVEKESDSLPCHLRKTTELQAKSGFTGGWCPKGDFLNNLADFRNL